MEIRLLKYFWTVAQEGNITRAAKLLAITQPTLSRQIKELEESIGLALFYRENNQLRLTSDGLFFKERAEEIIALNDKLELELKQITHAQLRGTINVGCVEADNSDTLALMLEELVGDYPEIKFSIFTGTSDEIAKNLDKGLLDVAILLEPIRLKEVEYLALPREEKWGFLVSKELFIANHHQLTPEDVYGLPILCSSRSEVQQLLADWAGCRLNELTIIGNFNLIFNVFSLVENKLGAALTIEGAIGNRELENLVFLPLAPAIKTTCALVWKKRVHSPVTQELIRRFKVAFDTPKKA